MLSSLDQGGAQSVTWSHDFLNRLTQIETTANSNVLSSHAYTYDSANQRIRADVVEHRSAADPAAESSWHYNFFPPAPVV